MRLGYGLQCISIPWSISDSLCDRTRSINHRPVLNDICSSSIKPASLASAKSLDAFDSIVPGRAHAFDALLIYVKRTKSLLYLYENCGGHVIHSSVPGPPQGIFLQRLYEVRGIHKRSSPARPRRHLELLSEWQSMSMISIAQMVYKSILLLWLNDTPSFCSSNIHSLVLCTFRSVLYLPSTSCAHLFNRTHIYVSFTENSYYFHHEVLYPNSRAPFCVDRSSPCALRRYWTCGHTLSYRHQQSWSSSPRCAPGSTWRCGSGSRCCC